MAFSSLRPTSVFIVLIVIVFIVVRLYITFVEELRSTTLTSFEELNNVKDHLIIDKRMRFDDFHKKLDIKYNSLITDITRRRGAVCFMSIGFTQTTYNIGKAIAKSKELNISVFYIVDLVESFEVWESEGGVTMVALNQSISDDGYVGAGAVYNLIKNTDIIDNTRKVIAWEKGLYLFLKLKKYFDMVWFIEDDVYIPSVQAFKNLYLKSIDRNADLVIRSNFENNEGKWQSQVKNKHGKKVLKNEWHWHFLKDNVLLPPPWYGSMACAVGMSTIMLNSLENYRLKRGHFEFIEVFFNTLAMHEHLNVYVPDELRTIQYRANWTCEHTISMPLNWFHPIKDKSQYRNCT